MGSGDINRLLHMKSYCMDIADAIKQLDNSYAKSVCSLLCNYGQRRHLGNSLKRYSCLVGILRKDYCRKRIKTPPDFGR